MLKAVQGPICEVAMRMFRLFSTVAAAALLLTACPDTDVDNDGDGVPSSEDCDDEDPNVFPGNVEVCNGLDDDCNELVDDRLEFSDWYPDVDVDEFGDEAADPVSSCMEEVDGHVLDATDCDDTEADVHPGAPELCNDRDDDCNGLIDDDVQYLDWYPDTDGDGFGDEDADPTNACDRPGEAWAADGGLDCDDTDPEINPDAEEIPGDGIDQNCDGFDAATCFEDLDLDGFGSENVVVNPEGGCDDPGYSSTDDDCDDTDDTIFPGATDVPDDGIDQNCSGFDTVTCYEDLDLDGFGSENVVLQDTGDCDAPGVSATNDDCDDADPLEFPGQIWYEDLDADTFGNALVSLTQCEQPADHVLDDTDCDDTDPNEFPGQTWYLDLDADTFGNALVSVLACEQPVGYVLDDTDCDDADPNALPGQVWFEDFDNDTFGNAASSLTQCLQPVGYVLDDTDCDDTDADEFPGQTWFQDSDGDAFGDLAVTQVQCEQPVGYVLDSTDCDDADADEFPGQTWYFDNDLDGFGDPAVSLVQCTQPAGYLLDNTDCDDNDRNALPGQTWYADTDNDTYGDPNNSQVACLQPVGFILDDTDCDDTNANAFPGAIWYADTDGDGFGDASASLTQCLPPAGYVVDNTDCDDNDADEFPGQVWYYDFDGDTFGDPAVSLTQCLQPTDYVTDDTDCDDNDITINTNGTEVCDGFDNDCNAVVDDGFPDLDTDGIADCVDPDADGDGDPSTTDCDDLEPLACSICGFAETCNDGIDNDCDAGTSCWESSYVDGTGNTMPLGPITPQTGPTGFGAWYDYGNIPASSNTGMEISNTVVMMTYLDPANGKLGIVMIADIPFDGAGGTLTVELSGMTGGQIAVMDDPGDNPSYTNPAGTALNQTTGIGLLTYNWVACCTDGFVVTDLDPLFCATIDITASTGVANGIVVYDGATPIPIPGSGGGGAQPAITFCETY